MILDISGLAAVDYRVLDWLHNHTVPYSVPVLQFISAINTYVSVAVTLLILLFSIILKSTGLRKKFIVLASVLLLVSLTSQGLKALIERDRPFEKYPVIEKLSDAGGSSFPSGHTLEAFAMASALCMLFSKRWIAYFAFAWAFLIAYSRMALGVHYPSDVIAGMITGIFIGWLVPWVFSLFPIKNVSKMPGAE